MASYASTGNPGVTSGPTRKPRILLAACGCAAAMKFANLCHCFCEWGEVVAVATEASLHFIDRNAMPRQVLLFTDREEWSSWKRLGDRVLHHELRNWADIMVIAPLSANTLAKIANGLSDNLLTSIVRSWDFQKPLFVAPAMTLAMWSNTTTEKHIIALEDIGVSYIPPQTTRLPNGEYGRGGAMEENSAIYSVVRLTVERKGAP